MKKENRYTDIFLSGMFFGGAIVMAYLQNATAAIFFVVAIVIAAKVNWLKNNYRN